MSEVKRHVVQAINHLIAAANTAYHQGASPDLAYINRAIDELQKISTLNNGGKNK